MIPIVLKTEDAEKLKAITDKSPADWTKADRKAMVAHNVLVIETLLKLGR